MHMTLNLTHLEKALPLIARGALVVVNHSAGKDSQAMLLRLKEIVPAEQLLLVHADLGEVEWAGNVEHIRATGCDLPLIVAKPVRGLLQMVEERFASRPEVPSWPSASSKQCTSDLKRGPIEREVRRFLKANPQFNGLVLNCMGMRAQESTSRAKATTWKKNEKNSVAGREWYDWQPIHAMTTDEVWATIADAGQKPHPIYAEGMTRLSCCFCIMASVGDLSTAARLNPALYAKYVRLERKTGYSLSMSGKMLEDITGIPVNDDGEVNLLALAA
jgi:3'-phosphoadenosine 5'-phosphosulfate sulfotransferase (PAPS reductase)/FAD synthetase